MKTLKEKQINEWVAFFKRINQSTITSESSSSKKAITIWQQEFEERAQMSESTNVLKQIDFKNDKSHEGSSLSVEPSLSFKDHVHESKKHIEAVFQAAKPYDVDKTGKIDFAFDFSSESLVASILFTLCTDKYDDNSNYLTFLNLLNSVHRDNCWPFRSQNGDLFIKLAAKITPSAFSIEHISKELSITNQIDSAPRNFIVYVST